MRRLVAEACAFKTGWCKCVAGIKAIKLYAWEQPYVDRITQLRCGCGHALWSIAARLVYERGEGQHL